MREFLSQRLMFRWAEPVTPIRDVEAALAGLACGLLILLRSDGLVNVRVAPETPLLPY